MANWAGAAGGVNDALHEMIAQRIFKEKHRAALQDMAKQQEFEQQRLQQGSRALDLQQQNQGLQTQLRQDALTQTKTNQQDLASDRDEQRFQAKLKILPKGTRLNPGETVDFAKRGYSGLMEPVQNEPAFQFAGTQDTENKESALEQKGLHDQVMQAIAQGRLDVSRLTADIARVRADNAGQNNAGAVVKEGIGPDGKPTLLSVNPRTGTASPVQMPSGYAPNRPARPVTQAERNAAAFFNRMLGAERDARSVEDQLSGVDLSALAAAPNFTGNLLLSGNAQKYKNAQRTFTEARLRKESGAAIPPAEFETDRTTNFKIIGDADSSQKRRQRLTTMRGIGASAGQALSDFYGEGATLDDLLKEFADLPVQGAAPKGVTITSIKQVQ